MIFLVTPWHEKRKRRKRSVTIAAVAVVLVVAVAVAVAVVTLALAHSLVQAPQNKKSGGLRGTSRARMPATTKFSAHFLLSHEIPP